MKSNQQHPYGRDVNFHWEHDEAEKQDQHFPKNSVLQRDRSGKVTYKEGPLRQTAQDGRTTPGNGA